MKRIRFVAIFVLLAILAAGCTLITDFDESLLDADSGVDAGLYALSEVVPDPVEVTLVSGNLGTMTFDLGSDQALPGEASALKALLTNGSILLQVVNDSTGTTCDLLDGELVDSPNMAGQYSVEIDDTMTVVVVTFYNGFDGKQIVAGGDYSAEIDVLANDYFETESFTRDVAVTQ